MLAGTGTGMAPLLAVARHALQRQHRGAIVLVHGAAGPGGLYLGSDLPARLAGAPGQVTWRTCRRSEGEDIVPAVLAGLAGLGGPPAGVTACLCGGPGSVQRMRRALFLAGMSLSDIMADQFTPAV